MWIKIKDKKPPLYTNILISGKRKYKDEKEYNYFVDMACIILKGDKEEYITFNDNYEGEEYYEITAWMLPPDVYIESEDK